MPSAIKQTLSAPPVPEMPTPGAQYSEATLRTSNGLLRTFMRKLTAGLQALFGPAGGQYIDNPNGLFFSTASQTPAAVNTGYPVTFNQTYLNNYVSVVDSSKFTVAIGGVYNFQYTGSVQSTSSSAKNIFFWIVRNGTTIGYSCAPYTLSGSGTYGRVAWNFSIDLDAGEYVQIYWGASDTTVSLTTVAASAPYPAIPAGICAVMYSSALPTTRPTAP